MLAVLVLGPRERPWRVRPVRASVVEKLRAAWVRLASSGSFDPAPPSAVSRDQSVRRSAQDDVFVVSWRCKKPASSRISIVCQNKLALTGQSPDDCDKLVCAGVQKATEGKRIQAACAGANVGHASSFLAPMWLGQGSGLKLYLSRTPSRIRSVVESTS